MCCCGCSLATAFVETGVNPEIGVPADQTPGTDTAVAVAFVVDGSNTATSGRLARFRRFLIERAAPVFRPAMQEPTVAVPRSANG